MQTVFRTEGSDFYAPGPSLYDLEVSHLRTPRQATHRLLCLLQCFTGVTMVDPALELPSEGETRVYANTLTGGYLVLQGTAQGATVYAANQRELARAGLPVPPGA